MKFQTEILGTKMDSNSLTPEESLLLISRTIEETKERFKQNGHIFIFWGTLILLVNVSQLILSLLHYYKFTMVPVLLYPLGAIFTFTYFRKEEKRHNIPKTIIGNILSTMGGIIGVNLIIMGFFCLNELGEDMAPVFIIFLALFIIVSGISIQFKPLLIGGLLLNLIGLGTFFLARDYHGFSMMLGAVAGLIIPGILLNNARRKEHV